MKTIGLCSANEERSGVFQAVTQHEVVEQNLQDKIQVYSAGLKVEKILASQSPLRIQINILKGGLAYGIVRDEIVQRVQEVVEQGYEQDHTDEIKALYGQVRPLIHGINFAFRNQALEEVGIDGKVVSPYGKFDVKEGFGLVLPMAEKDISSAEKRYDDAELERPAIMTYGQLVGAEDLQDKNMASGLEGARKKVEYFMDTRKEAVKQMMEYVK